jgi:hypothetical protein
MRNGSGEQDSLQQHLWLPSAIGPKLWLPENQARSRRKAEQYHLSSGLYVVSEDPTVALRSYLRRIPIEEFLGLVSRVSLIRTFESGSLSKFVAAQGWRPELAYRQYQLALLIGLLMDDFDASGSRQWPTANPLGRLRLLARWSNMASSMLAQADKLSDQDSYNSATAALVRLANQQFGDFEGLRSLYARTFLLYRECSKESETRVGKTLDEILLEQVGLDVDEILFLPLGLFAMLNANKKAWFFEANTMTRSPEFPGVTKDKVDCLFKWLSIDYQDFRAARRQPEMEVEDGYEPYHFNPLIEHPIIRTPEGT